MIDRLRLEDDGPDGMTLWVEDDSQGTVAFDVTAEALYEFLDSRAVAATLEHRAVGESIRVERNATGGLSYAEAFPEVDDHEKMREAADLMRDLEREK